MNQATNGFAEDCRSQPRSDKNHVNAQRLEVFIEICSYGINHFNQEIRDQLINIKYQVENNDFDGAFKKDNDKKKEEKLSDFGKQLLEALKAK